MQVIVADDGKHRFGILTDLGRLFSGLGDLIATLDAVRLESNYDPDMFANGPYPESLNKRIEGPGGHISNFEAAEVLKASASKRMKWPCLAHLSDKRYPPMTDADYERAAGRGANSGA
jgi:phosphoribosyl 1,2-cyclic phosphodiesterase